ncbi:MAG: flagellar basal body P-ring formation chaperone FlgA [Pseudomonadota bacterium]
MKIRSFYKAFFSVGTYSHQDILKSLGNLAMILLSLSPNDLQAQPAIVGIEQLRLDIAQFLTAEYRSTNATRVNIKVGALDSRLRLECDQPLAFNLQDPSNNGGNVNTQVACRGTSQWTILVPAQATVFRPMAVASRNLQRGELVNSEDVGVEVLDASQYRQGYSSNPEDIIGKELKYPVNKGDAFRESALNTQLAIKRGDEVSLESLAGSIRVVTTGTAITNGRIGQQIRVKNNQSTRIVSAKVIGPGKVQSIL